MLTATSSDNGDVSLACSTSGSSFEWKKNGHSFATTSVPSKVDSTPDSDYLYYDPLDASISYIGTFSDFYSAQHLNTSKNYRKSTTVGDKIVITTTARNIGFYFDTIGVANLHLDSAPLTHRVRIKVDGIEKVVARLYTRADYAPYRYNIICWGCGLDGQEHIIELSVVSGTVIFGGYKASHFRASYNDTLQYSVTIDGSITETVNHITTLNYFTVSRLKANALIAETPSTDIFSLLARIDECSIVYERTGMEALRTRP